MPITTRTTSFISSEAFQPNRLVVLLPCGLCCEGDAPASAGVYALPLVHFFIKRFVNVRGETSFSSRIFSYFVVMTLGADDLGVRYLLPIFPLLLIWCSRIAIELKKKRGLALLVLLLLWQARAAVWAFPNYISYFNEIAGGAKAGIYYLDDSNVDWGQGMKQAAEYVHSRRLDKVELFAVLAFRQSSSITASTARSATISKPTHDDFRPTSSRNLHRECSSSDSDDVHPAGMESSRMRLTESVIRCGCSVLNYRRLESALWHHACLCPAGGNDLDYTGRTVLLTGAGGFIGSHLVEELVTCGASVRAFLHYNSRGDEGNLKYLTSEIRREIETIYGDLDGS